MHFRLPFLFLLCNSPFSYRCALNTCSHQTWHMHIHKRRNFSSHNRNQPIPILRSLLRPRLGAYRAPYHRPAFYPQGSSQENSHVTLFMRPPIIKRADLNIETYDPRVTMDVIMIRSERDLRVCVFMDRRVPANLWLGHISYSYVNLVPLGGTKAPSNRFFLEKGNWR